MLIVEDDGGFASVIAEAAQGHGYATVLCGSGRQAVALLQQERFAAVILDILLPDVSGWQIFRRLRSQPLHRTTPVHIISCVPQPTDWLDDSTHYLVKPIGREDLERVFDDLEASAPPEPHRLLLVEDVAIERDHYRDHLEELGFSVTATSSAEGRARPTRTGISPRWWWTWTCPTRTVSTCSTASIDSVRWLTREW